MVEITQAKSDADLQGILALQRKNLAVNLSPEEVADQGFVTVVHHLDILRRMNEAGAHTIAKDGDQTHLREVLAYCVSCLNEIADLLKPFMPDTSDKIHAIFKDGIVRMSETTLFPRLEEK